jgi:hypothetical protein
MTRYANQHDNQVMLEIIFCDEGKGIYWAQKPL